MNADEILAKIRNTPEPVELESDEFVWAQNNLPARHFSVEWRPKGKHGSVDLALRIDGKVVHKAGSPIFRPPLKMELIKCVGGPLAQARVLPSDTVIPFPDGVYERTTRVVRKKEQEVFVWRSA